MKKCDKPEPDAMYSKDEFDSIHWFCKNCGEEIVRIKQNDEKEFRWAHGRIIKTLELTQDKELN
jgi:hypothetical protein